MSGTFFGIGVAQSGLAAQKRAMEVLGYNVAHANDPTYKRQRVVVNEGMVVAQSQEAGIGGAMSIGTGVSTSDIERVRDTLVESRLRDASQGAAQWDYMSSTMKQIEAAIGEPSDSGLQTNLDKFWSSWTAVSNTPDDLAVRNNLLQDTQTMCQQIQYVYSQMGNIKQDVNSALQDRVGNVNLIANQISQLNTEIGTLQSGQMPVNDLLNRRDALVMDLSKIVSINQTGEDPSNFIISIGGRVLVQGTKVNELESKLDANNNATVTWKDDGKDVLFSGGEMKAMTDIRDNMIPDYMAQLDNVASTLVTQVNTLHRTGKDYTGADGGDFFKVGTTAANITLDDNIIGNPKLIAASGDGKIGDNSVALDIVDLKNTQVSNGLTIDQIYSNFVSSVASSTSVADTQSSAHQLTAEQYTQQQQSVSGVSLDEEMGNMIKFQQAYNAASRSLTAMDDMLSTLIDKTGLVGR